MTDQINQLIMKAKEKAYKETDSEPEAALTSAVNWPVDCKVGLGLEGAVACETTIGYVNGSKGWLIYRGLDCFDLSEHSTFEETSYLLIFGNLPTKKELADFNAKLTEYRVLTDEEWAAVNALPLGKAHPMADLRTGVSVLGLLDPTSEDTSVEAETEVAIKLLAKVSTLTGIIARLRKGLEPVQADPSLSLAADLVRMMTDKTPSEEDAKVMDVCLILHADHGMNASTFTSMVVNSSLSDMYSSIVAGIGSLKGPLHGGANEAVLKTLEEIGSPDKVSEWYKQARTNKKKVMGFGHRVYKAYDPRARILLPLAELLSKRDPETQKLYEIAIKLEAVVIEELGKEKKIFPNVDFYSGIVYTAMGIETEMFTPIFAVSRVAGWTARVLEYLKTNRIFRPRGIYVGPAYVEYVTLDKRG
jgi:citrate synthase